MRNDDMDIGLNLQPSANKPLLIIFNILLEWLAIFERIWGPVGKQRPMPTFRWLRVWFNKLNRKKAVVCI